tara:strand:- start:69 stop:668 length:600 start_codon:yes stop_codon:yes gene_type:complete
VKKLNIFILILIIYCGGGEIAEEPTTTTTSTTTTSSSTTTTATSTTTTTSGFLTPDDVYESEESENSSTTTKKSSQCEVWESETTSNQKLMQLNLIDFDEANEDYKNNSINADEFKIILDNLSNKTLDILIKQEKLKPNSSNKESSKFYEESFAGFYSAFNLYSLYLEEGVSQYKIDSDYELGLAVENSKNAVLYKSSC